MRRESTLPADPGSLVEGLLAQDRRVLLFGAPGSGKSTLAAQLADQLVARGRPCHCIGADPGSPAFGIPGALALGGRASGTWRPVSVEPLCTLDAGRFRLPLISAVRRLVFRAPPGMLLLDCPGVVRGVAGSELLRALVDVAAVDLVLAIAPPGRAPPLVDELWALPVECRWIRGAAEARRPGKRARARRRTAQWDTYLSRASLSEVELENLAVIGTPPPRDEPDTWARRQVALLRAGHCIAMGEVVRLRAGCLTLRAPEQVVEPDTLLLRDVVRGGNGLLESAAPFAAGAFAYLPPAALLADNAADRGPRAVARVGAVDAGLVNGIFGDPLLHVRFRHQARSLLFDLGDGSRLSARVAHQVSDVFISHAHMDHLGGFLWLLRSRIGDLRSCRLYGPPGLARHIQGLIDGFLWDRVGDRGPEFEVGELHGETLRWVRLQAGRAGPETLPATTVSEGVVRREPGFRVRAISLDHHTPVIAYAFEPDSEIKVRKDRLQVSGLAPGPWLNELKQRVTRGAMSGPLHLPDGREVAVDALAQELLMVSPGKRLVYATDLADTPDNRQRLIALARHAHTLFLEAAFSEADRERAVIHGHLTARACGEIASAADVVRLVPFHLSRRYADVPSVVFDEIEAVCGRLARPGLQALKRPADGGGSLQDGGETR